MSRSLLITSLLLILNSVHGIRYGEEATTLHFPTNDNEEDISSRYLSMLSSAVSGVEGRTTDEAVDRVRRSVASNPHQPSPNLTTIAAFNDSHFQMVVHWAGGGNSHMIALTKDIRAGPNSTSSVFLSDNYGASFTEIQSSRMRIANRYPALIEKFYISPQRSNVYVFADVLHNYTFVSDNYCHTILAHPAPFSPQHIAFHATNTRVLIGHDENDPQKRLWISFNLGASWRMLQTGVKTFFWGVTPHDEPDTIFVQRQTTYGSSIILQSDNYFSGRPITLLTGIIDFEVQKEYLFATKNETYSNGTWSLALYVSYNRGPFHRADFPGVRSHRDYFVADASEGQAFVVVSHANGSNHLYISDVEGYSFVQSLSNIVYFNPKHPGHVSISLRRSVKKPFADLHKVNGLRGVYIASQYDGSELSPRNQSSTITFDKGARWRPVVAPSQDSTGSATNCTYSWYTSDSHGSYHWGTRCSLHLTQYFHFLYPLTRNIPILSKENAVGLIMATGNTGSTIANDVNVYLSNDGGAVWSEVLQGPHFYAFGDHGGIIVAVRQGVLTGELLFSHDEGETWESYEFSSDKVFVYGLLTEPGEKTTTFSIFASRPARHSWIIVQANLSTVLGHPCQSDDYKQWSPTDSPRIDCLLGRHTVYERRRAHSLCFNGVDYERQISSENCSCSLNDYECDVGYRHTSVWSTLCIRDTSSGVNVSQIPADCREGGYYLRSKGYRRIAGDTCEGGLDYRYDPEHISCPIGGNEEFILYTTRNSIHRYLFAGRHVEDLYTPQIRNALAVDFNYNTKCVYWADSQLHQIQKMCLDGDNLSEVLVTEELESIEGLAYNWLSDQIVWVDADKKTIEVARGDGSHRRGLISTNMEKPRAIALCPKYGWMYWTDWSETDPRIERSWMDGTHRSVITRGQSIIHWPNGLTIDYQLERIYWTDAYLHKISYMDLDGSNLRVLVQSTSSLPHPYAIAVYMDQLYVTDWSRHAILTTDKHEGRRVEVLLGSITGILDLKILHHASQQGSGPCSRAHGGCSSLCMERPNNATSFFPLNRTCLCSDEFPVHVVIADNNEQCECSGHTHPNANGTCEAIGNTTCASNMFTCSNRRCIPATWRCDRDNDCGDGSDERDCPYSTCNQNQFSCDNLRCIPASFVCDSDNDCGDGSDENDCSHATCRPGYFACNNHRCITKSWICDGDDDCHDMSDEANCSLTTTLPTTCSSNQFRCHSGWVSCVPVSYLCDGDSDCSDGSDEAQCSNATVRPSSCEYGFFTCDNGYCIYNSWVCDGDRDCTNGEDERHCNSSASTTSPRPTSSGTCTDWRSVSCGNGYCIYPENICDGVRDCPDNSDELNCGGLTTRRPCRTGEWQCSNGQCIPAGGLCNGVTNCYDGSDEAYCVTEAPCNRYEYQCLSGDCIYMSRYCNGIVDCPGGDDEAPPCNLTDVCRDQYRCRWGGACVDYSLICNGIKDCSDGSDELGCITTTQLPPQTACLPHQFTCPDSSCIPLWSTCDGLYDCRSGMDEDHDFCALPHVVGLSATAGNATITVQWSGMKPQNSAHHVHVFVCDVRSSVCHNKTVAHSPVVFTQLTSGTYLCFARVDSDRGLGSSPEHTQVTLNSNMPAPPTLIDAVVVYERILPYSQPQFAVKVTWFHLVQYQAAQYMVYFRDAASGVVTSATATSEGVAYLGEQGPVLAQITNGHSYYIWVTVTVNRVTSEPSRSPVVHFDSDIIECQSDVSTSSITDTSVTVSWTKTAMAQSYLLEVYSTITLEHLSFSLHSSKASHQVEGLSPGVVYLISLQPRTSYGLGVPCEGQFYTTGDLVPTVTNLTVTNVSSTGIYVQFNSAQKTPDTNYTVYFSPDQSRIENLYDRNDTMYVEKKVLVGRTATIISWLLGCRYYCVRVQITAPHRGGLSSSQCVNTNEDGRMEMTNVAVADVKVDSYNASLRVTWENPCERMHKQLSYIVEITDSTGKIDDFTATKQQLIVAGYKRGEVCTVRVRVQAERAVFSKPVTHAVALYPAPVDFHIVEIADGCDGCTLLQWTPPPKLSLTKSEYHYVIQKSENTSGLTDGSIDTSNNHTFSKLGQTEETYYSVSPEADEKLLYVRVCMSVHGYLSRCTEPLAVWKQLSPNQPTSSSTNLVPFLVPAGVVIVVLVALLVVYVVRHRRLQNSFSTFANSRYNRQAGTTSFGDDLDGEDAPMIRGFSDDEPLVLA